MDDYRLFQLIGKLNLSAEPVSLVLSLRFVIVKVETDFSDGLNFFLTCQFLYSAQHILVHGLGIVRMDTYGRIAPC